MQLEQDIADFPGTESAILYSQAFSTISSIITAFGKRGDIIVADRGIYFARRACKFLAAPFAGVTTTTWRASRTFWRA